MYKTPKSKLLERLIPQRGKGGSATASVFMITVPPPCGCRHRILKHSKPEPEDGLSLGVGTGRPNPAHCLHWTPLALMRVLHDPPSLSTTLPLSMVHPETPKVNKHSCLVRVSLFVSDCHATPPVCL